MSSIHQGIPSCFGKQRVSKSSCHTNWVVFHHSLLKPSDFYSISTPEIPVLWEFDPFFHAVREVLRFLFYLTQAIDFSQLSSAIIVCYNVLALSFTVLATVLNPWSQENPPSSSFMFHPDLDPIPPGSISMHVILTLADISWWDLAALLGCSPSPVSICQHFPSHVCWDLTLITDLVARRVGGLDPKQGEGVGLKWDWTPMVLCVRSHLILSGRNESLLWRTWNSEMNLCRCQYPTARGVAST